MRPVAPADDLQRAIALSIPARTDADLVVFPARGWVVVEDEPVTCGTGHGSPWDYDRHVPVAMFGAGVARDHGDRRSIPQERVADMVAGLLGLGPEWRPAD